MSEEYYMKKPCVHCPFRTDVRPFLHPDRAYEISAIAMNPFNEFHCHKTTVSAEEVYGEHFDDELHGNTMLAVETSKHCAGFLTMRATETDRGLPKGFVPSFDMCYESPMEMEYYYDNLDDWEADFGEQIEHDGEEDKI